MMTETQIEIAAREYCRLAGIDAEKKVGASPLPNADGTVNMVCLWVPAWKQVAEMIAQQDLVLHCIDVANADVRARPALEKEKVTQENGAAGRCPATPCSALEVLPLALYANDELWGLGISTAALGMLAYKYFVDSDDKIRDAIVKAREAGNLVLDSDEVIRWAERPLAASNTTTEQTPSTP